MRKTIRRVMIVTAMGAALAGIGVLAPQSAFAWNAPGSGNGYSKAVTMPTGAKPTFSVSVRNVTVNWTASTVLVGTPVSGYTVARYNSSSGVLQTIGASCSGTISALTCTETAVPTGSWKYTVTPRQGLWVGTEGFKSNTVTVAAATLAFTSPTSITSLPTTLNGNLTQYATGETLTFHIGSAGGTVLTGSISPDPIPSTGLATFSVTIPAGTTVGSHPVYGIGSLGTSANASITVVDNVAPTITASVISKSTGDTPGFIKQGGSYRIYANVTDPAPTSGISTVTANVTNITTGSTAVTLSSGGPFTVGGVSYNYRSATQTATNPLAAGAKTYTITATDGSANSTTSSPYSVTIDNTAPTGTDVQAINKTGGVVGKAEVGDTIVYTFSEAIDPNSIQANWTGASTNVTVHLNNQTTAGDTVTIFNSANSSQLPLGSIDLIDTNYTAANITFTSSTMVMSGSTITITLGTTTGSPGVGGSAGAMAWTPSATATDQAGNACSTGAANESGASDTEF